MKAPAAELLIGSGEHSQDVPVEGRRNHSKWMLEVHNLMIVVIYELL